MMAATHRLGGAVAGILAAEILIPGNQEILKTVSIVGGAVIGSLIPDIDNAKSSISRKIPLASIIVSLFQTFFRGLAELLPNKEEKILRGVVGHRGITHSLLILPITYFVFLLARKIEVIQNYKEFTFFIAGVLIGMTSHLILDMFAGGVPLFCPITNKRITIAHIKTGGLVEVILRTLAVIILVATVFEKVDISRFI